MNRLIECNCRVDFWFWNLQLHYSFKSCDFIGWLVLLVCTVGWAKTRVELNYKIFTLYLSVLLLGVFLIWGCTFNLIILSSRDYRLYGLMKLSAIFDDFNDDLDFFESLDNYIDYGLTALGFLVWKNVVVVAFGLCLLGLKLTTESCMDFFPLSDDFCLGCTMYGLGSMSSNKLSIL